MALPADSERSAVAALPSRTRLRQSAMGADQCGDKVSVHVDVEGGARDAITTTVDPDGTSDPAGGLVSMTSPGGTAVLDCCWRSALSPSPRSSVIALIAVFPASVGTVTVGSPLETKMVTVVPSGTALPAVGSCVAT